MPSFSRHDIDSFAYKAVDNLAEGISLQDSVVKLARDNSMNPEQIKRLVESTNTNAFLKQFKGKSGNQRMVEFDVADSSKAINTALGGESSSDSSKVPNISITISAGGSDSEDLFSDIADEYAPKVASPTYHEKVASYDEEFAKDKPLSSYMIHKYKDSLLTKLAGCNYGAEEAADNIASSFRGIYSKKKYASFELDSLSKFGNAAMPALQMVRTRLGMNKLARKLSSTEEYYLADRHIISTENSNLLEKVAEIASLSKEHKSLSTGLDYFANTNKEY
jgi:hypothetical protein